MLKLFLIAGEPSGDRLGAALMAGLKQLTPVEFHGIGGPAMQAVLVPIEEWRRVSRPGGPTLKELLLNAPRDEEFANLLLKRRKYRHRPPPTFD